MKTTFTTTILKDDTTTATGLPIPDDAIAALGPKKNPAVVVTFSNGYSYRSTVAVMGGVFMLPLSAERRTAAGVKGGDQVEVTLELDLAPRTVDVPADLASALAEKPSTRAALDASSYSTRKEFVRQVEDAKTPETRTRRIANVVAKLTKSD